MIIHKEIYWNMKKDFNILFESANITTVRP